MNKNVKDVINILRRDVSMPWIYPKWIFGGLRWEIYEEYYERERRICPLGLHYSANCKLPSLKNHFDNHFFTIDQIDDFIDWWDNLKDPKKAYKAIWG